MGEDRGTAAEPHILAQVVATLLAIVTVPTHYTRLDSHPLPQGKVCYARSNGSDDTGRFMTEYERCAHREVAVSAVHVIMY